MDINKRNFHRKTTRKIERKIERNRKDTWFVKLFCKTQTLSDNVYPDIVSVPSLSSVNQYALGNNPIFM